MKYSLRSLMLVMAIAPPLLAVAWATAKEAWATAEAAIYSCELEPVYGCEHPVVYVDWNKAVAEVKALEIVKFQAKDAAQNSAKQP